MSDPEQEEESDPTFPREYAPRWLRERNEGANLVPLMRPMREQDLSILPAREETFVHLPRQPVPDLRDRNPRDVFAEALAQAGLQQPEPEFADNPPIRQNQRPLDIALRFVVALGVSALAVLVFVFVFPGSRDKAEDRGSSGAAQVSKQPRPASAAPDGVAAPFVTAVPQQQKVPASQARPAVIAPAPPVAVAPVPPADAEPGIRKIDAAEVAAFVKRAQELLAAGDLQSARLLLLRATQARDPGAALALAKTFDPIVLKQSGATMPQADLAQARSWYQKAEEWGAPDARRQLDALAGYDH